MSITRLTSDTLEFLLLSFEGPDQYSTAGGLGVRMKELAYELARQGFQTHLVFVGDPSLPAQESPLENLTLYRWSQHLSAQYSTGVYAGEEAKVADWNERLPAFAAAEIARPAVGRGHLLAIMAEEWHTAYTACRISDHLWAEGLRDKAFVLWNANNIMGFDRIDWRRLDFCTDITTVSRYMKHIMWNWGVNPLVIPNGIPQERIRNADPHLVARLRAAFPGRELVFKIGRFSPDKRWNMAVEALAREKERGQAIAAVIRGGVEPHGLEVLGNARALGLSIVEVDLPTDPAQAVEALAAAPFADIYQITSFMSDEVISLLYTAADAVLANSGHEPFGLVGLEVMAAGGVAFVGSTGEDYAVPYLNSVVLDTEDPAEICIALQFLRTHPEAVARLRADAQETARSFTWENVILQTLLGKLAYVASRQEDQRLAVAGMQATFAGTPERSATSPEPGGWSPPSPPDESRGQLEPGEQPSDTVSRTGQSGAPDRPPAAYGGQAVNRRIPIKPWPGCVEE